jgi:Ni/Co efflux regulator RcnB
MKKFLPGCAAAALLVTLALPGAATAAEKADGARNLDAYAWSSHRRSYRHKHVRRYIEDDGPRYGHRPYRSYRSHSYDRGYRGYGYDRRPGVSVGVGGFGVHVR